MANLRKVFISHSWAYSEDYDTIKEWLDDPNYLRFADYSISVDKKIIGLTGKQLENAIVEQIRQCSVFIVPTAVYSSYSDWVKFEIETAINMKKPILAIKPRAQIHNSVIVTTKADKTVGWMSSSVIEGIKELTAPSFVKSD